VFGETVRSLQLSVLDIYVIIQFAIDGHPAPLGRLSAARPFLGLRPRLKHPGPLVRMDITIIPDTEIDR
jgi:hypothetical protein